MTDFRIGLIDSNEMVRSGRTMIFNSQPNMQVVLEESDPLRAIERAPEYLIDVLLVGPSQFSLRGLGLIELLTKALYEAKNDCAVIAYNAFTSGRNRFDALFWGAQEFIGLDSNASELLGLVHKVTKRDFLVSPSELLKLKNEFGARVTSNHLELKLSELNDVQTKIVELFLLGESDQAIAKQLQLARTRVTQLIHSLIQSAAVTSRNQLALLLLENPA